MSKAQHPPSYRPMPGRSVAEDYVGLPNEPRPVSTLCVLERFRPVQTRRLNSSTMESCIEACAQELDWCVSLQHAWREYSCPAIRGLGMGFQGRCYESECMLLSVDRAGLRCDQVAGALLPSDANPLEGQKYYVAAPHNETAY